MNVKGCQWHHRIQKLHTSFCLWYVNREVSRSNSVTMTPLCKSACFTFDLNLHNFNSHRQPFTLCCCGQNLECHLFVAFWAEAETWQHIYPFIILILELLYFVVFRQLEKCVQTLSAVTLVFAEWPRFSTTYKCTQRGDGRLISMWSSFPTRFGYFLRYSITFMRSWNVGMRFWPIITNFTYHA